MRLKKKHKQFLIYFIGLKKIPVFKIGQNLFSLQVFLLPSLPRAVNAV